MDIFSALNKIVLGNDQDRKAAKEYLEELDPEIWKEQARSTAESGVSLRV